MLMSVFMDIVLHSLHVHPTGTKFLIFCLISFNEKEWFISEGTFAHVFGPLNLIVSVPFATLRTLQVWTGFSDLNS